MSMQTKVLRVNLCKLYVPLAKRVERNLLISISINFCSYILKRKFLMSLNSESVFKCFKILNYLIFNSFSKVKCLLIFV